MDRSNFRRRFDAAGPVILPVIHVADAAQTRRNMDVALAEGGHGVFLINHDFGVDAFVPVIEAARAAFPDAWIGVNFLAVTGRDAFPVLARLREAGVRVDGYWADDARIDERRAAQDQHKAGEIDMVRASAGWDGLYFGGTAFKKQRQVAPDHHARAAQLAAGHMDVVTTSGVATGSAAALGKVAAFRRGCGNTALAVASGITPDNAGAYARDVDCFMVATGINRDGDFYTIDAARLRRLAAIAEREEQGL